MDLDTELKFTQYWTQGRVLYKQRCLNCHQNSGKGMEQLIPPLAGSDYLNDPQQVACAIKNGLQGKIVVNDTVYNGIMPANPDLSPLEIAELITYIGNTWGNTQGFTTVRDAEKLLNACEQK
jgi:mono/diheme cytochrome c family protein